MSESKAGMLFTCVCCGDDSEEKDATYDGCLKGPVCPTCNFNLKCSAAWLKHGGLFPCTDQHNT